MDEDIDDFEQRFAEMMSSDVNMEGRVFVNNEMQAALNELIDTAEQFEVKLGNQNNALPENVRQYADWEKMEILMHFVEQAETILTQQRENINLLHMTYISVDMRMNTRVQRGLEELQTQLGQIVRRLKRQWETVMRFDDVEYAIARSRERARLGEETYDLQENVRKLTKARNDLQQTETCIDLFTQWLLPEMKQQIRRRRYTNDSCQAAIHYHVTTIASLQHERNYLENLVDLMEDAANERRRLPTDTRVENIASRVYANMDQQREAYRLIRN